MRKAYKDMMENITVTEQMRIRILNQILAGDLNEQPSQEIHRKLFGKYFAAAACLIVFTSGVFFWNYVQNEERTKPPEYVLSFYHEQVSSRKELSKLVGFPVAEAGSLPFEIKESSYYAYQQEMAEIVYKGDRQQAVFRMSIGNEDNSGDYTVYEDEIELETGGMTVHLKGADGQYVLAVWSDGQYSYSLSLSAGQAQEIWAGMIANIS